MASLFISYSNRDERAAVGLQTWLREHAYEPVLVPRTKKQEQGDFKALKTELQREIDKADCVLFLVTPFWQAAKLCQWEMDSAKSAGKPLVAILEAPSSVELSGAVFIVDMTKNRELALVSLKGELQRLVDEGRLSTSSKSRGGKTGYRSSGSDEVVLQGAIISDHDGKRLAPDESPAKLERPSKRRQLRVNRTLKVLRRGIRWSAFPGWLTNALGLPVAGAKIKNRTSLKSLIKKLFLKMPKFRPLGKQATNWVIADKIRVFGVAFLLFVFATALIGTIKDRTIGGKDAMRKELANVKTRQSLLLSRVANHLSETGDQETAMLLALEAIEEAQQQDDRRQARDALYTSWIKMQSKLVFKGHDNHVSGAVFSPDGKSILSSSWDRTARIWSIASKRQILVLDKHDGFVNTARYSPDQSLVVTAALDNKARLFNARTGKLIRVLKGHSHDLTSAVFSANGRRIVTASGDQTARIWEVAGGQSLKTFLGHKAGLEYAEFSPDGKRIVTASADNMARILDAESAEQLALLSGHTDVVRSARYDPKGEVIATASQDKTVRLWEARSGVLLRVLKGHEWAVLMASFSPDGMRIVTASKDNTARLWDVKTGRQLLVLRGHKGIVAQASFSPDGKMIVTASGDGTIRLWPLVTSDQDLISRARRTAKKCLTLSQRKKYSLGDPLPKWCAKLKKKPFVK